jgi:hypothetical protein
MRKNFWLVVAASLIGLQGCSSGGTPSTPSSEPPKPSSSSSGSSSSSSSSSSSISSSTSSSSSSSSSGSSAGLTAAKSLVSSVRSVVYFDFEDSIDSLGRLFVGDTRAAFYAFRDKVYKAQLVNGAQPDYLLEALGKVGNVITKALGDNIEGSATSATMITLEGVTVAFTPVPAGLGWTHTYKIQQAVNVCDGRLGEDSSACTVDVDLTAVVNFGRAPTGSNGATSQKLDAKTVKVNLNGSLKNAYLSAVFLPLIDSNHVSADSLSYESDEADQAGWDSSSAMLIELGPLALNLPLRLTRLPGNDILAEVNLKATADGLLLQVSNNTRSEFVAGTEVNTSDLRIGFWQFDKVKIEAGANVRSAGESFVFSAKVDQPTAVVSLADSPKYTLVSTSVESCPSGTRCTTDSDFEILGETATAFLPLAVVADFDAVLTGVPASGMTLNMSRESNKLMDLSQLIVTSKDGIFNLDGVLDWYGDIKSLTASNSSGTTFTVQSSNLGARSGSIKAMNGSVLATVADRGTEFDVKYTDGTSTTFK